jgi:peroxiredoxin/rhodanese-related sulfurtransferase
MNSWTRSKQWITVFRYGFRQHLKEKVMRSIKQIAAIAALAIAANAGARAAAVGEAAPDFTLKTHDGKSLTLSNLKGKRGAVLVFFATWCPGCMEEVPAVKKFVDASRDKNVLVYGIDIQQEQRVIDRFVKDRDINYRVLLDTDAAAARAYEVNAIPSVIGVDADGIIRYRDYMLPADTEAFIKTLTAPLAATAAEKPAAKPAEPAKTPPAATPAAQTPAATPEAAAVDKPAPAAAKDDKAAAEGVRFIDRQTLAKWFESEKGLVVIDVLPADSYAESHIKGSISIPMGELDKKAATLDKNAKVVTYCASFTCQASTASAKKLMALGFKDVSDYKGGLKDWKEGGLAVEGNGK